MTQLSGRDFDALCDRAVSLVAGERRAILGIAGPPGAGKSTLARSVAAAVNDLRSGWAAYIPMDGFHLADVQLARLGLLDRKGAPETFDVDGYARFLVRLRADEEEVVYAPGFERELEQPIAAAIAVSAASRLILTEGNYLLVPTDPWRRVHSVLDEVWYCELDVTTRVERLVARHVEFGKSPSDAREWVLRSDEANARLVGANRDDADLVISMETMSAQASVGAPDGGAMNPR